MTPGTRVWVQFPCGVACFATRVVRVNRGNVWVENGALSAAGGVVESGPGSAMRRPTWNDHDLSGFRPEPSWSPWTYVTLSQMRLQARQEQALREKRGPRVEAVQLTLLETDHA